MKKIAIPIVFLAIAAAMPLAAGDAPLDLVTKLDFRATTTWGWDIDSNNTGFESVINWLSLSFTPIGWKTQTSAPPENPGEPYMYFSVTGLDLTIMNTQNRYGSSPTGSPDYTWLSFFNLTSKLVISPLWIGLQMQGDGKTQTWNYDDFIADRAFIGSRTFYRALQSGGLENDEDWYEYYGEKETYKSEHWTTKYRDLFQAKYATFGRVLVGYDSDLINLIGKIGSRYPWYDPAGVDTANTDQEYAFGVDALLKLLPGLKIALDAYGTTYIDNTGDPMFSVRATYDIPVIGQITLQPFLAFDNQIHVEGMDMEIVAGINVPWPGGGWKVDPIYILYNSSPDVLTLPPRSDTPRHRYTKADTFGGFTLGASYYTQPDLETPRTLIDCSVFEAQGDEGLLLDVGFVMSAQVYDLLDTPEIGIGCYWDYEILNDSLRPMIALQYQDYDGDTGDNFNVIAGIHYIKIPGVTVGIEYASGNLIADEIEFGTAYVFLSLCY